MAFAESAFVYIGLLSNKPRHCMPSVFSWSFTETSVDSSTNQHVAVFLNWFQVNGIRIQLWNVLLSSFRGNKVRGRQNWSIQDLISDHQNWCCKQILSWKFTSYSIFRLAPWDFLQPPCPLQSSIPEKVRRSVFVLTLCRLLKVPIQACIQGWCIITRNAKSTVWHCIMNAPDGCVPGIPTNYSEQSQFVMQAWTLRTTKCSTTECTSAPLVENNSERTAASNKKGNKRSYPWS